MPVPASDPLVSIIIPAYNRQDYLPATLASCRAQTWPHLEVIVVDDGSTDETAAIADAAAREDARFRVIRAPNQGPCAARNLGLAQSRGHWIKFLDSDDLLASDAVERLLLAVQRHGVELACGKALGFWDQELPTVQEKLIQLQSLHPPGRESETEPFASLYELNEKRNPTFNEILIARSLVEKVGGFDTRLFAAEEFNLYLRLSTHVPQLPAVYLPSPPILLKRYHLTSLAVQSRSQKEIPWLLRSLRYAAEDYLSLSGPAQREVDPEIKRYLFNRLYESLVDAYRNDVADEAEACWQIWQRGGLPKPLLSPWYHHWLHQLLSPQQAERVLRGIRHLRDGWRKLTSTITS